MNTAERLAMALHSGNLESSPHKLRDVDYLTALGMVGVHHKTASKLYRLLHSLDKALYHDVLKDVLQRVSHLAKKRGWSVKPHDYPEIARTALDFVISPVCPTCHGRKFESIADTGRLSDVACCACGGTGLRRIDSRYVAEIAHDLNSFESRIVGEVEKRMAA